MSTALSVIIPAYNEADRLPVTMQQVLPFLRSHVASFEVIVVDDGSSDETGTVVKKLAEQVPEVKLISYQQNRGKGYAVRLGMLEASGESRLLYDADGATPIAELKRLEAALLQGADVAIGSRAMASEDTAISTVWYRKYLGRIFNNTVNLLILPGIADTQCGFKLFTARAARVVFELQTAERFSFDVEILFIARRAGFKIAEIPINWTNIPGSKVNLLKDSLQMLKDVFRFRWFGFIGRYKSI